MNKMVRHGMPTPALKIIGIGLPVFAFVFPFKVAYKETIASIGGVLLNIPVSILLIAIPVVLSLAYHYRKAKQKATGSEIIISYLLPFIIMLPGMVGAHQHLLGWTNYKPNIFIGISGIMALTAIYLNLSIVFRNKDSEWSKQFGKAMPYFALFAAGLANILFPFWPLC